MNRGFTLLELLIYLAIVSVVVTALTSALIMFNNVRAKTEAIMETDEALRFVSEMIARDVERASSIATPLQGEVGSVLSLIAYDNLSIEYRMQGSYLEKTTGSTTEKLTGNTIVVESVRFERTENFQPQLNATTTGISWIIRIRHASLATEYGYYAERRGSTKIRNE